MLLSIRSRRHLPDALWLLALCVYVLGGTVLTPFHGDESTTIWMSKDYAYVVDGNFARMRYNDPPLDAPEQQLRLITGSLTKYLIGLSWSLNGYSQNEINEQWHWGFDWNWNQDNGHLPDDTLLMLGRWPSALMLAAGVVAMFALAWQIGERPVAYLSSLYYALNPALLLNGRRAMFEGGLILFTLLTVLAAIYFLRQRNWYAALLLALTSGFALSAKHPAMFTVVTVFVVIGTVFLWEKRKNLRLAMPILSKLVLAGVFACVLFYILHPIWWGDNPIIRAEQVYDGRDEMLNGQVMAFGGYETNQEQLAGFVRQVIIVRPQYYEVPGWENFIAGQISEYEQSVWRGVSIGGSVPGTVILCLFVLVGFWKLFSADHIDGYVRILAGIWSAVMLLTAAILTPIEWQRYYLTAHLPVGLLASCGIVLIYQLLVGMLRNQPSQPVTD